MSIYRRYILNALSAVLMVGAVMTSEVFAQRIHDTAASARVMDSQATAAR
jgi:hypothetical protein